MWKLSPPPFKISRYTTADPGCSVKKIWLLVLAPPLKKCFRHRWLQCSTIVLFFASVEMSFSISTVL